MKSNFFSVAKSFAILCGTAVASGASLAADTNLAPSSPTYDRPAVEIGGGIANEGESGEINFLAPMVFSEGKDLLFFGADVKFSGFNINDTGDTVYNAGGYLGYRRLLDDDGGVLGLWAGVDYFNTDLSNEFARAIAGVEYFGSHVIARANAFVPFDSTSSEWTVTSGGFINTYDEKVPSGFDAELGLRMPVAMDSFVKPGEFRIFAGGYDFIGLDDDGGNVLGGRARAELDLYVFDEHPDTRLSFETSYAYDKHSGDQYGAGVKLSIPLGVTNKISEHGSKDATVAELDSFGQDLFQPVRRNRENVSRIRLKDRVAVVTPGTGGTAGVTLSNVCGGASGSLALNSGLGSSNIKQGSAVGIIDPSGAATPLNLTLANMVDSSGQTLTQLLASSPQSVNATLTFPATTVNFASQVVQPAAAVASTGSAATAQKITSATVTINGSSCSMNVQTEPYQAALTLATICGGANTPINVVVTGSSISVASKISPMAKVSSGILQGATLGDYPLTYDPNTGTPLTFKTLKLILATMMDSSGQTLVQLLAAGPTTLATTLNFPLSEFDPNADFYSPVTALTDPLGFPGCSQYISGISLAVASNNQCTLNATSSMACLSDMRLKHSIAPLAVTAAGYKIYSFKYNASYKPDDKTYVGVMAQDVVQSHPEAVKTTRDGYYSVRYDRLGLRMATLEDYQRRGLAAVEIGH